MAGWVLSLRLLRPGAQGRVSGKAARQKDRVLDSSSSPRERPRGTLSFKVTLILYSEASTPRLSLVGQVATTQQVSMIYYVVQHINSNE